MSRLGPNGAHHADSHETVEPATFNPSPVSDYQGPSKLVESSRASLILQGLLPAGESSRHQLDEALIEGRFCELRMLFYIGKDLVRWIEQCTEFAARDPELAGRGIRSQSFAKLLVSDPPAPVKSKLDKWGVSDYRSIFSRALGLSAIFAEAPTKENLTEDFIRNYYRFADQLFLCAQAGAHPDIHSSEFEFELFASGEYSRMLEREWER